MKRHTAKLLLVAFLIAFLPAFSQTGKNKGRTVNAKAIEQDISLFISENMDRYDLTPEAMLQIDKMFSNNMASGYSVSKQVYVQQVKQHELRKLYFNTYSSARETLDEEDDIRYICENGGFDDGVTDDFTFFSDIITSGPYDCDTEAAVPETASLTVNDFTATVTLVDDDTSISGGFEPILNTLGVDIPRINSGTTALKLNNNNGNNNITTMSRPFIVNSDEISFSYFFLAHDPGTAVNQRPHFIARVRLPDGTLVQELCIHADAANTLQFDSVTAPGSTVPVVYTGWQCAVLSLGKLVEGDEAILEFTVTDGVVKDFFGTVYLDDICVNDGGCSPKIGSIRMYANSTKCLPWPIKVCGVYTLPYTTNTNPVLFGTLTSIQLNVYDAAAMSSPPVFTTTTTSSLTDSTFCFEIDEADLNPSILQYEYSVTANFDVLGTPYSVTFNSSNVGPDLDITDCVSGGEDCPDCPDATAAVTTGTDYIQAYTCINAYNSISGTGTEAIYHAGYEIVLHPDFEAISGTKDRFYILGCTSPEEYTARYAAPGTMEDFEVNLQEILPNNNTVRLYPNPASNRVNILSDNMAIRSVTLTGTDGRQIAHIDCTDVKEYMLDLTQVTPGVYLISVTKADGTVVSRQIVKK